MFSQFYVTLCCGNGASNSASPNLDLIVAPSALLYGNLRDRLWSLLLTLGRWKSRTQNVGIKSFSVSIQAPFHKQTACLAGHQVLHFSPATGCRGVVRWATLPLPPPGVAEQCWAWTPGCLRVHVTRSPSGSVSRPLFSQLPQIQAFDLFSCCGQLCLLVARCISKMHPEGQRTNSDPA